MFPKSLAAVMYFMNRSLFFVGHVWTAMSLVVLLRHVIELSGI